MTACRFLWNRFLQQRTAFLGMSYSESYSEQFATTDSLLLAIFSAGFYLQISCWELGMSFEAVSLNVTEPLYVVTCISTRAKNLENIS